MCYNHDKYGLRQFLLQVLQSLYTDPVVFMSALGPFIIGHAFHFGMGELTNSGGVNETTVFLKHEITGGIVDYTIQFYTALLAWVILLMRGYHRVGFNFARRHVDSKYLDLESLLFLFSITVLLVAGLFLFFLGYGATEELISSYATRGIVVGETALPLPTRLFGFRIILATTAFWAGSIIRRKWNV
jgi:hypothetical protein